MFYSLLYQRTFFVLLFLSFSHLTQSDDIWKDYIVKSGDNLSVIFKKIGLPIQDALDVSSSSKEAKTFVRMIPGEKLSFLIKDDLLDQIRYVISPKVTIVIKKNISEEPNANLYSINREEANKEDTGQLPLIDPASNRDISGHINSDEYNAIEKKIFILNKEDTLNTVIQKANLPIDHVDYLNATKNSQHVFENFKENDEVSLLIVDNSLLELIYKPTIGSLVTFTRSIDLPNHYKKTLPSNFSSSNTPTTSIDNSISNSTTIIKQPTAQLILSNPLQEAILPDPNRIDNWVYYTVEPDDNLSTIFIKAGLTHSDVYYVDHASKEDKVFNKMQPGQKIGFLIRNKFLIKIKYIVTPLKSVVINRIDKSDYQVDILERKPETVINYSQGSINSSLFVDALNAGLSNNLIMNFAKVFAWDIDFSQDIQPGDKFKVIYEELTIDGSKIRDGNIIAAQFESGGKELTGIFYRDTQGDIGFYTPEGKSMRKAFLRMPVEFARISSKFNPRRKHPIYNTVRAHKGVDYAAKTGTPILASGNGKIIHLGRKGGYGKTIIIKHGDSISTLYAHMSSYNKILKVGSRVTQGQTIGYVGATGAVTGAHLHYEFRVNGIHKNPLTVKLPKALALNETELVKFKIVADTALEKLAGYKTQHIEPTVTPKEDNETIASNNKDITNE